MKTIMGSLLVASVLMGGLLNFSQGQSSTSNIRIIDIKLEKVSLPSEATRSTAPAKELGDEWYMAEVKFSTPDKGGDVIESMIDELQVKFYIDGLDSLKDDAFVVLTGEQTYLNVPKGEHYAVMYLDPTSVIRYGGKKDQARGFSKSSFHAEILVAGKVEDEKSKNKEAGKKDPNWFQGSPSTGVLIGLKDSPWWPFEARRYNRIKNKN